ncbi:MAG: HEAT repeat domain-containing protein [Bacteroidetes bacterium]|nr:HEAT repeat domain-containing protein [Bacteroidota bacterium]
MRRPFLPLTFCFLGAIFGIASGRQVVKHEGPDVPFQEKWSWALKEGSRVSGNGFWVAYSVQRLMDENSYIATGMHFSGSVDNRMSLYDVILENQPYAGTFADSSRKRRTTGLSMMSRGRKTIFKVMKDIAILVFYSEGRNKVEDVQLANMELNVELKKKPLVWLGPANDDASVSNLERIYRDIPSAELKENIVNAVGIHQQAQGSLSFLVKTLKSNEPVKARSQAAFWIGHLARSEALNVLSEVALSNDAREVREQTVFAISQIESDEALDKLISLARKANDSEVRRKATFWLGQKASKKAAGALEDMLADDDDTEVQKQALIALAQMRGGSGVEKLIQVAKAHPKLKLRKQAIMSLGNSDDPRAREALIEIARSK